MNVVLKQRYGQYYLFNRRISSVDLSHPSKKRSSKIKDQNRNGTKVGMVDLETVAVLVVLVMLVVMLVMMVVPVQAGVDAIKACQVDGKETMPLGIYKLKLLATKNRLLLIFPMVVLVMLVTLQPT